MTIVNAHRTATIQRHTRETNIRLTLDLDGAGQYTVDTGVGFLDHMLAHIAVHGMLDLELQASGDLDVDAHHTVEDVALVLGQAIDQALGKRAGIVRMASAYVAMYEACACVAIGLAGLPCAVTGMPWAGEAVGGLPVTLLAHFFESLAVTARANIHARVLYGRDNHHMAEALFKALGRALDAAIQIDPRRSGAIPSTKGTL